MASPTSASPGPRRLGRYTILESLAKGGMAQVYLAQKDNSPEICVLKQLLGELESHATAGKRFYREAHVASYLQHPRIARTIDAGFEDGTFCIAMEFIAGRDVESLMHLLMRQGRMLPYELSLSVALGVLDGLEYAHDARDPAGEPLDLVHRDLSPRNVMLSYDGEVKIIDFGLARGKVDDFKTAPGMILGTLRYVSPEQAVADPIDRRSDLYSIAVVLYEMLSGRPLVRDGKALEVLTDVVQRIPEPLSVRNPHLPRSLDPVLAKALAKDPNDRYPTARELRLALESAAGNLARTPKAVVGEFVSSLFPEEREKAMAQLALGRRRHLELAGRAPQLTDAAGTLTMAGVAADDRGSRTRTGFVDVLAMDAPTDEHGSRTRTGWVAPVGLSPADVGLPTRTVVDGTPEAALPRPAAISHFDPLITTLGPARDVTRAMMAPDERTAAVDLSTRTQLNPIARAPRATPERGWLGAALVGVVLVAGAAMVIAAVLWRDPTELAPAVVAEAAPAAPVGASAAPVAMRAEPAVAEAARPAPSTASAPTAPPRASESPRRSADARRAEPSDPPVAPVAPAASTHERAAPRPPAARGARTLREAVASLRADWDGLSSKDQFQRLEALAARIADASPNAETRKRVASMTDAAQFGGDADDITKLERALDLVEKSGTP